MSYERIRRIPIIHSNICYLGAKASKSKESSQSTQDNFTGITDPLALQAIESLIGSQGVTPEISEQRAQRRSVADSAGELSKNYSTENAFALSKDAVAGLVRGLTEKNQPTIDRAVEAGGVSGGSFSALAKQDLAARTAEQGASLAAKLVASFGDLATKNKQTQASLSTIDPSSLDALLKAVGATQISTVTAQSTSKGKSSSAEGSFFGG